MPFQTYPQLAPTPTQSVFKEEFPNITMFDASTFYNWEQDNIPLQELVKRTDTLFHHVGLNQDNLPDATVTYTLSSAGNVDSDIGIYDDIHDILDLIPKRLTYPVLVEICTYGALPEFELSDIVTEGDGQLEIVNRLFSHTASSIMKAASSVYGEGRNQLENFTISAGDNTDEDSSKAWYNITDASSHRFGLNLYDAVQWGHTTARGFWQRGPDQVEETKSLTASVEGIFFGDAGYKGFSGMPYRSDCDPTIVTEDVDPSSMSNYRDNLSVVTPLQDTRATPVVNTSRASSYLYGNVCSGVTVRGCHGKITLRGLCTDGSNNLMGVSLNHMRSHGFEVVDSDIVLESCAAMRCSKAGIFVKNSELTVASGLICYRNYNLSGGSRTVLGSDEYGVGLHATNSEIYFETVNEDSGPDKLDNASQPNERRNLYNFVKNNTGILLESSKLHGGTLWNHGGDGLNDPPRTRGCSLDEVTSFIQAFGNDVGFKLESSQITYLGILESFLNNYGVKANNSVLKLTQFNIEENTHAGFDLDSSKLIYGYQGDKISGGPATGSASVRGHWANSSASYKRAYTCSQNGQNLLIRNSSQCVPADVGTVLTNLGTWGGAGALINSGAKNLIYDYMHSVGASPRLAKMVGSVDSSWTCDLPAIVVTGGSYAEFVGLACAAKTNAAPIKGACVSITDNSKVDFRGHALSWTSLTCAPSNAMATAELAHNWQTAGVYVGQNSVAEFTGPTKISRFGVPVLAEDGSTVKFGPATLPGSPIGFDLDRFDLSSTPGVTTNDSNHTKVELHSTRAGLVANRNSNIIIHNIGGGANDGQITDTVDNFYNSGATGASLKNPYLDMNSCTSAGYFRFFPNGFSKTAAGKECVKLANNATNHQRSNSLVATPGATENGAKWHRNNYTNGGMCVRAVGNSNVDVNGVNFSFEYDPSSCSGVFYDMEGNDRARTTTTGDTCTSPYKVNNQNWWFQAGAAMAGDKKNHYMIDTSSFSQLGASSLTTLTALYVDTKNQGLYSASGFLPGPPASGTMAGTANNISYAAYATNLMLWNIADTSRIHAANVKMSNGTAAANSNVSDPSAFCLTAVAHGPNGKWANGVALDYFGEGGLGTTFNPKLRTANTGRHYENYGMFRLLLGHRGDLKSLVEVSAGYGTAHEIVSPNSLTNGGAMDQINSAGYQTYVSQAIPLSGSDERLVMGLEGGNDFYGTSGGTMQLSGVEDVFGQGWAASAVNEPAGIQGSMTWYHDELGNLRGGLPNAPIPPLHMDWQGYMRNWLDESASNLFTNAKHAASKKVNAVSIYRSTGESGRGGEGRDDSAFSTSTFGVGVRSLNLFDLDRLL